jgi:uncharacterized protein (TIGR02145 family)
MKKIIAISCLIALAISTFISCKKDDNNPDSESPYNGKTTSQFNPEITYGTMTDQDGNVYKTITFNANSKDGIPQTWMAENLRTTKYNDGTVISNVTDDVSWAGLTTGAYSSYNNTTSSDSIATFGFLYNYFVIETGKIAPTGWHIPTAEEWDRLIWYGGGPVIGGGGMKEVGTTHWAEPNKWGSNTTGFTALPSGHRHYLGSFFNLGEVAKWWASESNSQFNTAKACSLGYSGGGASVGDYNSKIEGLSIRLVKD